MSANAGQTFNSAMRIVPRIVLMKVNGVKLAALLHTLHLIHQHHIIKRAANPLAGEQACLVANGRFRSMESKLKLVKGRQSKSALVYGVRIFTADNVAAVEDGRVNLTDGSSSRVTMHLIEGTRAEIRRQLLQSLDAFFELLDEDSVQT